MPYINSYDSDYFESNIDASDLQAVISLRNIKSLTIDSIKNLNSLGIFTVSDLIRYKPIHDAKFLLALNEGEIVHDYDFNHLTKTPGKSLIEVLNAECDELKSVSAPDNIILKDSLGINTVRTLANYSAYAEALELIEKSNNIFNEAPSAPHELIPRLKGSVHSLMKYTNFVREKTIKLPVSCFVYDEYTNKVADDQLKEIFIPTLREQSGLKIEKYLKIHLGYIAEFKQKWVFINTQLGEIVHSLALAPGESRNIAIIDWKHSQTTSKTENTNASEKLTNSFTHSRALNEITNATARENQKGTTNVEGGAIGGSLAFTSGSGTNVGAAGKGNYEGIEGAGAAGAAAGHGEGAVFSGGYSKGTITSDTNGERNITAQMSQNITDTVSQLASDVRSLWSVVVAEDTQTENRQINTRNVTNYNHSHALTVQYYEVLHRYRAEVKLNEVVPILYLPYSPLNFDINLIAKYWHLFKNYVNVDKDKLANYQPVIDYYNSGKASNAIVEYRLMQLQVKVNIKRNESNGILEGKLDIPGVISNSTTQTSFDKTNVELVFQYPDTPTSALPITNFKKLFIYSGSESAADIYIRMKFINSSGQERMKEISVNAFALFPDSNGTGGYTQKAEYSLDDDLVASFKAEEKPSDLLIGEIEQIFKSRKYFFTSLLLQSAEPQQLIDLIQGITIKPSNDIGDIYLTDFIDFSPIGVSGNNILFKLKHFVNSESSSSTANGIKNSLQFRNEIISDLANAFENENNQTLKSFREIVAYFEDVKTEVMQKQKNNVSAEDIYLPTSGIFAEAILGRSNASEKIDITRFYNWQDSPIPNLAPQINPVDPNTELKNPPLNTNSNLTPQVLNYFNTPQLPDPTGMTGVMQAIQNGNMFRDMSKSETLLGVLTNLTNFSTELAKLSSTMAGDTQKSTIAAATEIAKAAVSALNGSGIGGGAGTGGSRTGSGLGSGNGINTSNGSTGTIGSQITTPAKPASTQTEKGGAINVLDNAQKDGSLNEGDIGTSKVLTAGGTISDSGGGVGGVGNFINNAVNQAVLGAIPGAKTVTATINNPGARQGCALMQWQFPLIGVDSLDPSSLTGHKKGGLRRMGPFLNDGGPVGYIYTAHVGLVDISHVRDNADMTKFIYDALCTGTTVFNLFCGKATVKQLPEDKTSLLELAGAMAYVDSWAHELITYGDPIEDCSSFSPEDLCSNIIGIECAKRAINLGGLFDDDMDKILPGLIIHELKAVSKSDTDKVFAKIKGLWYDDNYLIKRNFDGIPWRAGMPFDAFVSVPWLSPLTFVPFYSEFTYEVNGSVSGVPGVTLKTMQSETDTIKSIFNHVPPFGRDKGE